MQTKNILTIVVMTLVLSISSIFGLGNVLADENDIIYTNINGVELTQEEYDFVNEFYGSDFFATMTEEDYEWLEDLNINDSDVSVEHYIEIPQYSTFGTVHSTGSKQISISRSCSNLCTVITSVKWFINPSVRSYDVIGARFRNITRASNSAIYSKIVSSAGTQYYYDNLIYANGIGTSMLLPSGATNLRAEQKFYTNLPDDSSIVFASYQHATQNISLYTSQLYTISYLGEGNVFEFYGNAVGKFDQMGGVYIYMN